MPWVFAILVVAPAVLVAVSRRAHGRERTRWVLITLLLSWFGWLAFHLAMNRRRRLTVPPAR